MAPVVARRYRGSQLRFYSSVHLAEAISPRDRYRVANRLRVGASVTNYRDSFDSQQRRSAVFRVIELFFELLKRRARQHRASLGLNRCLHLVLQQSHYELEYSFADFERDVPRESIANDDVHLSRVHIATLDVADKV